MGFGPSFIGCLICFIVMYVVLSMLSRGVRQGLSPVTPAFLYVLVPEVLAGNIHVNPLISGLALPSSSIALCFCVCR